MNARLSGRRPVNPIVPLTEDFHVVQQLHIAHTKLEQAVRFTFTTTSMLFWTCWIGVLLAHLRLSYPAIVCRGHPPLAPNNLIALFIGPLFGGLPAILGDTDRRRIGVMVGAAGFTIIYALALINLNDARPSVGYLAGISGIVRTYHVGVVLISAILYVPTVIALYFIERVLGDLIRLITPGVHHKIAEPSDARADWQGLLDKRGEIPPG